MKLTEKNEKTENNIIKASDIIKDVSYRQFVSQKARQITMGIKLY